MVTPRSLLPLFMLPLSAEALAGTPTTCNVADFPGGFTQTAIQNAIAACGTGDVFIPKGTYTISAPIDVPDHIYLHGEGSATVLAADPGNKACIIHLAGGSQSRISELALQGPDGSPLANGIEFKDATSSITIDHLWFGSGLNVGLNIAPNNATGGVGGIYQIANLRWEGVVRSNVGIQIGDGTHLITDVQISNVSGTSADGSMGVWVSINTATDSVLIRDTTFYRGIRGLWVGYNAVSEALKVTGDIFSNVVVDSMSTVGIEITKGQDLQIIGGAAQTSGTGIILRDLAQGVRISGTTVQTNQMDGILINSGAVGTQITGCLINNNVATTGPFHAFANGITVSANTNDFIIANNIIGDGINTSDPVGYQSYGIYIYSGTSGGYIVTQNRLPQNALYDGGHPMAPATKYVYGNLER